MKKVITLITALIICCLAVACDPSSYLFEDDFLADVVGIDLVTYNNDKQKNFTSWVPDHEKNLISIDLNEINIIETLSTEYYPDFLDQLAKDRFLYKYYAYDSPQGLCIRLRHENGDFTLVNARTEDFRLQSFAGYVGRFDANGQVVQFVGCFEDGADFVDLVNDYFSTQLNNAD